jgi:hypothetical protein
VAIQKEKRKDWIATPMLLPGSSPGFAGLAMTASKDYALNVLITNKFIKKYTL